MTLRFYYGLLLGVKRLQYAEGVKIKRIKDKEKDFFSGNQLMRS